MYELDNPGWDNYSDSLGNISFNEVPERSRTLSALYILNNSIVGSPDQQANVTNVPVFYLCYESLEGNLTITFTTGIPSEYSNFHFNWNQIDIGPLSMGATPLLNFSGPLNLFVQPDQNQGEEVLSLIFINYYPMTFNSEQIELDSQYVVKSGGCKYLTFFRDIRYLYADILICVIRYNRP